MRVKISNKDGFFFIVLLLSFMHAVLRSSPESSFSAYRFLLPISLMVIFVKMYRITVNYFIILILLILYNLILTYFYCNEYTHFGVMVLHYVSLFNVFVVIKYLYKKYSFIRLYLFFKKFFYMSIIVAVLEYIFKFRLPNTAIYEDGSVSAFNWNQNELGTALLGFFILYVVFEKNSILKWGIISVYFWLNFVNDAKIVFIVSLLLILLYSYKVYFPKWIKYILNFLAIFGVFVLVSLPYDNIYVSFRDYDISLAELLTDPINHIFTLTPFPDLGASITTRANGVIYAIQEFINSNFMGIGIGNTLVMLEKPEYNMKVAKSIHNLPVQILVENGIIILLIYVKLVMYFVKVMWREKSFNTILAYIAIPCLFLGSMGSSVGIFSNYFYMSCMFFMILILTENSSENKFDGYKHNKG